jgi:hypothetical protein
MTRDWFAVWAKIVHLPKFRHLSDDAQLTLIYVWAIAGEQDPEATWQSLEELGDLVELNGRPRDSLTDLVARHWLDVAADGMVSAHDWDAHQFAASEAARAAWERLYMRDWRRRKRGAPLSDNSHPRGEEIRREESSRQHVDNMPTETRSNGGSIAPKATATKRSDAVPGDSEAKRALRAKIEASAARANEI